MDSDTAALLFYSRLAVRRAEALRAEAARACQETARVLAASRALLGRVDGHGTEQGLVGATATAVPGGAPPDPRPPPGDRPG